MNNPAIIEINFINWEKHLNEGVILLDFWADWCNACVAQDEIFNTIADELKGKLKIGKVNVSENRILAEKFGVQNIPQVILFKSGKEMLRMQGFQDQAQLMNRIKKHIK